MVELELTRFCGHIILCAQEVASVHGTYPILSGVPPSDGRAHSSRSLASAPLALAARCLRPVHHQMDGQAVIGDGKRLRSTEALTSVEREELLDLHRLAARTINLYSGKKIHRLNTATQQ